MITYQNEEKCFDCVSFKKILKLSRKYKLEKALVKFQEYLMRYPKDIEAYIYYADTLIKLNALQEAEKILETAKRLMTKETILATQEDYYIMKIKLLCCQRKYHECYQLFRANMKIYVKRNMDTTCLLLFLKQKLGILSPKDYKYNGYLVNQILSYNEQRALQHIKEHFHFDEKYKSQFLDDFPAEEVYYNLRKWLPFENKCISGTITELYLLRYENNGKVSGRFANYLEIVTLQNSNKIISLYPYENTECRNYMKYTTFLEEENKLKRSIG